MVYERHAAHAARFMNEIVSAFLLTFAALFPIVNPIEAAPFFYGMTAGLSSAERNVMARKVAINGFSLLLGSVVLGPYLLEFFGIRLPVVRIAGGFVVTALGWKLLTQEDWSDHVGSADLPKGRRQVGSFYPLTMPLTVGPGSMSVAITIGSRKEPGIRRWRRSPATPPGRCSACSPSHSPSILPIASPRSWRGCWGHRP